MKSLSQQMLLEEHFKRAEILVENTCLTLPSDQAQIVRGIYRTLKPLFEAELTPEKIKKIFADVQAGSTAAGGNRTAVGKAKDAVAGGAELYKKTMDSLGKWLQDSRPVQYFDQKFEKLQDTISAKFPQLAQHTKQLGEWAKSNPGKTTAIIGVLTAISGLATGPGGMAVAGHILRGTTELLKGEKLSTAVGRGAQSAALGWLTGQTVSGIGNMISGITELLNPLPIEGFRKFYVENIGNGLPSTFRDASIYGTKEQLSQFNQLWSRAEQLWQRQAFDGARAAFEQAEKYAAQITAQTMKEMGSDPGKTLRTIDSVFNGLSTAAQAAATGALPTQPSQAKTAATPQPVKESNRVKLSPKKSITVIRECGEITEMMISEGVMDTLRTAGTNLTTKITADKLETAWKRAKSPTDSEELAQFLMNQGVTPAIVNSVYQGNSIPPPKNEPQQAQTQPQAAQQQAQPAAPASGGLPLETIQQQIGTLSLQDLEGLLAVIDELNSTQQSTSSTTPAAASSTQPSDGLTPGQREQQLARQQMAQTQQKNAKTSAADNELVARVKAEKAKPGFQQDKGLLRRAAQKGIYENFDNYDLLNRLIESIVTEQDDFGEPAGEWLKSYIEPQISEFNIKPQNQQTLDGLIGKFEKQWLDNGRFPKDVAAQIAKLLKSLARMQTRDKYGDVKGEKKSERGMADQSADEQPSTSGSGSSLGDPNNPITRMFKNPRQLRTAEEGTFATMDFIKNNQPQLFNKLFRGTNAEKLYDKWLQGKSGTSTT